MKKLIILSILSIGLQANAYHVDLTNGSQGCSFGPLYESTGMTTMSVQRAGHPTGTATIIRSPYGAPSITYTNYGESLKNHMNWVDRTLPSGLYYVDGGWQTVPYSLYSSRRPH